MSLLLLDETAGDLPVRDSSPKPSVITAIQDVSAIARPTKARGLKTRMREPVARTWQHVSQMNRAELEDGFLRLHDENLVLKEFACKQEDRIKRLGTKLLRRTHERAQVEGQLGARARWSGQDLEESLEELQERVWDLERRNEGLRSRLLSYKQQLQLHGCRRHWPYGYVQPRVDTGLRQVHTSGGRVTERHHRGMRVRIPEARPTHTAPPRYRDHITEGVRADMERLCVPPPPSTMEGVAAPESQLSHSLVLAELEPESQCLAWGREMDLDGAPSQQYHQQALEHRAAIRGNVELIRLQRLLRERSCELAVTRGRFSDLQEAYESQLQQNQETLRTSSEALLAQVEELTVQLKAETQKVLALESKVESVSFLQGALEEFQERIRSLEKERDLLKEDYDKLLESSLACEQQHGNISRLEEQLSLELAEKRGLMEELAQERARSEELKLEVERGNQTPEQKPDPTLSQPPCLDRLPTEQEELFAQQSLSRRLRETEAAHADTILELEKTRDMLILQHRLNQDYQAELDGVMVQAEQEKRGHEEKQQKMAQLLDLRSTRIRQLEEQLKDVAYGTRQLPLLRTEGDVDVEEVKAPVLRRGENLFELHIAGAVLSGEALQLLGEVQPVTFCTYAFYDFETHCTPVVRGAQPRYSFTSQYVIQAEPLFLQYLQRAAARLDLHLATATDHSTLASCWLRFREVLGSGERMHATAMLHGPSGENYGMLEYWMRLCLPMEQTIRLHCERTKALGYLLACMPQARAAQQSRQQDKEGVLDAEWLWNELQVQIVGCTGLRGRWLSTQPSPYAMYRFFTFPDHDTPIIPSSNNPHFGDLRTFPMHPTAELDRYLRLESLWVYIFDDEDTEPGSYLGKAQIPLLPLARGHCITGDFVLTDPAGHPNGSISLSLEWKRQYLPPGAALHQAAWARKHQHERPLEQLIEEERAALHNQARLAPSISPSQPEGQRKKLHILAVKADGCRGKWNGGASSQTQPNPVPASSGYTLEEGEEVAPVGDSAEGTLEGKEAQAGEEEAEHSAKDAETSARTQRLEPKSLALDIGSAPEDMAPEEAGEPALESSSDAQTTDSDEIVVGTSLGSPPKVDMERIHIEIVSLSLHPEAEAMASEHIQQLYVEYHFPGVPLAETETPLSLRKPQGSEEIYFHFSKAVQWITPGPEALLMGKGGHDWFNSAPFPSPSQGLSSPTDSASWQRPHRPSSCCTTPWGAEQHGPGPPQWAPSQRGECGAGRWTTNSLGTVATLGSLEMGRLSPSDPRLQFVVVSEPLPGTGGECEDVGFAYIDLREILLTGNDVLEHDLDVVSPQDRSAIGRLKVSVEAAAALCTIYWEGRRKAEEE
ncbi:X-linked retinitis pigmentosa GTPase regulator-interacting protein 1 [Terrapene carolina triunguis]|uniref:X-linked retinitis pigmentosa GTPase regulator-interacting protein 1 n=1 Tax=Terrapene triunguis TaxID=2587831 RepID=UPI0011566A4A|nr:X-linked retinitis pigmentosa GTPase regulator-interacting protein 1 [Terrapene carolina triunguis]